MPKRQATATRLLTLPPETLERVRNAPRPKAKAEKRERKSKTPPEPRRYDPYGRPVTSIVSFTERKSHSQEYSHTSAGYKTVNHYNDLLALRFIRESKAGKAIRFVVRAGEVIRMP